MQLLATPPRWHELSQKENRKAITLDVPMCPFSHFRGMLWGSGAGIRNLSSFFCVCWAWSKVKILYNFISWLFRKWLKVFFSRSVLKNSYQVFIQFHRANYLDIKVFASLQIYILMTSSLGSTTGSHFLLSFHADQLIHTYPPP